MKTTSRVMPKAKEFTPLCLFESGRLYIASQTCNAIVLCTKTDSSLFGVIVQSNTFSIGYTNDSCPWNGDVFEPFYGEVVIKQE